MNVALTVVVSPEAGPWRRIRFIPRSDGTGWWRCRDVWTGCRWREAERTRVEALEWVCRAVDADGECYRPVEGQA